MCSMNIHHQQHSALMEDNIIVLKFDDSKIPEFKEVRGKQYVYFGEDNDYPNYLIKLFNKSAKHNAIINGKVTYIFGEGFYCKVEDPVADRFIFKVNSANESLNDIAKKCAIDIEIFGGFYLNIIPNRLGEISEIYHLDFNRVRANEDCSQFFYKNDWITNRDKPKEYPAFNQEKGAGSQIYYFKCYQPNLTYYPIPDWSAGQRAIEIDIEAKNFHMNNLRKGMVPSLWVNYNNGIPGEEEQRILVRAMEEQYGGTDNAGQAIISFNESKEQSPEIVQIPRNDHDSYYQTLNDDITRTILSAHRVSSAELFGIATAGKLGGGNEIVEHSEYFRKMVIQPYQNEILPAFSKLVSLKFDKPTTFEVKPLSLYAFRLNILYLF